MEKSSFACPAVQIATACFMLSPVRCVPARYFSEIATLTCLSRGFSGDSVSALLKSIQSESEQFKAVSFGGEAGTPLPATTTVGELIRSPFRVHVGGQSYKIAPPSYTGEPFTE
jgi:hypothetical protein